MGLPNKGTALLIDLGCEGERARGLLEYLDPAETYVFYANAFADPEFVDAVIERNADIIERQGKGHMIAYPFGNLKALDLQLESLCRELSEKYRVILAPLGPKPFSLVSLLLSTRLPMIDVWQVTATRNRPADRHALGPISVCKASFVDS